MRKDKRLVYREVQRPRQIWAWAIVLLMAVFCWYAFIQQILFEIPIGDKPAPDAALIIIWIIFGVIFPVVMIGFLKLLVEVREDGMYIRFLPFHLEYRKFLYEDIESYEPVNYSMLDFGGWGIRTNLEGDTAYTMNGKQGVRLRLKNSSVVIGTKNQSELLSAMASKK